MENTGKDNLKSMLSTPKEYTALISVHIPFSSLEGKRMDYKSVTKSIAMKTKTHIECYRLSYLSKMGFCIFGKWRDCLQAGRLLWYQLIRETTIYAHSEWSQELEKPLNDQKGKTFRYLYRSVKYKGLNDYNLLSISGPCWDVLKVRKELIKRKSTQLNDQQSINAKREITALQILKCIRDDIHDDIHIPDSIYSIRNSQLVQLLTGSKIITSIDQIEEIRCPKEEYVFINTQSQPNHKCLEESNLLPNSRELSKQDMIASLASILRQLSLESTDTQILVQVQQLLDSKSCRGNGTVDSVGEVMMNFKPKRFSLFRSNLKSNSNQLKTDRNAAEVENHSIESYCIERVSLENVSQIDSCSEKIEKNVVSMYKNNNSMIPTSDSVVFLPEKVETDQQTNERREHYLISERIKQLIGNHKHSLHDEITNKNNDNNHNNDCSEKFVGFKPKNSKSLPKDTNNNRMFRSDLTRNQTSSSNYTLLPTNTNSVKSLRKPFINL